MKRKVIQIANSTQLISLPRKWSQKYGVKKGDEITINYDGVVYRYVVRDTATVAPTKIEVLAQQFDKHELTLITCTPLGTYWKRFVVRAELVN